MAPSVAELEQKTEDHVVDAVASLKTAARSIVNNGLPDLSGENLPVGLFFNSHPRLVLTLS